MRRSLVLITLLVIFFTACSAEKPAEAPPLKIAVNHWPGFLPAVLADELGYFEEEGVPVEVFFSENARQQRLEFESGAYDAITLSVGSLVAVCAEAPETRVIMLTDISTTGDAVVVSPEIESIEDLQGKRIIAASAGYGEIVVKAMLNTVGLEGTDVVWVELPGTNEAIDMLIDGRVQAYQTWEPFVSRAVDQGAKVIFSGADIPGLIPDAVGFHGDVLEDRPEDVQAFMKAWFRAVDYWHANPDEAAKIISAAIDIPESEAQLDGLDLLTLKQNKSFFHEGTDFSLIFFTADYYIDYFAKKGILQNEIEVEDFLDSRFILEIE